MRFILMINLLIFSFQFLHASDFDGVKKNKKHSIFLKNNFSIFDSYERNFYQSIYRNFYHRGSQESNYYEIGLNYNIFDSKFYIESSFYELKKDSYSSNRYSCRSDSCFNYIDDVGNYFRTQFKSNIKYELYNDNILIKGGLRYIKSELREAGSYSFYNRFGQRIFGPNLGIKLSTDSFYDFVLSVDYDIFYLRGNFRNEFGSTLPSDFLDYTMNNTNSGGYTFGNEFEFKLSYYFNERFYIGMGYSQLRSFIKPNNVYVNTFNVERDLRRNLDFTFLGGRSFEDSFRNTVFELGIKFE